VTTTWLQVAHLDAYASQATGVSEARSKVILRQQDAAHRRHLSAVKTLATVRKLLCPAPSPVEIASRMGAPAAVARRRREAVDEVAAASN
jgi:hypothetical protein